MRSPLLHCHNTIEGGILVDINQRLPCLCQSIIDTVGNRSGADEQLGYIGQPGFFRHFA
jgi:hypothetical protein